ncbi:MAG: DUF456 domain-containing protein [Caldilineales bacterium]|nr:DUF456 domain-containing protein [Caldilineales bacterium]MDW8317461.1 DUF456 domain-containing protein [Anaerolineae bacterium]
MGSTASPLAFLAYFLMLLGLIGAVVPVLPGPVLIWLGSLLWAWQDGFQRVGWPTLLLLLVLTVLAWGFDLILTTFISRRNGVSWRSILAAIVGGVLGGLLFGGFLPVVGTVVAAVLGSAVGMLLVEYYDKQSWPLALRAGRNYILAFTLASLVEAWLAVLMIVVFAWQAFFQA